MEIVPELATETMDEAVKKPPIWPMYRAVVGVGVACALVIVLVYEITRPIIERNRFELRQQAIMDVLPGTASSVAYRLTEEGHFEPTTSDDDAPDLVFAGFDEDNALVGLAIETQAMGYQDTIRLLYGYSFELGSHHRYTCSGEP